MFGQNTNKSFGGYDTGGYTTAPTPVQDPNKGFSSWSGDMFNTIGALGTAFFNSKAGYPSGQGGYSPYPDYYAPPTNNNNMLYIAGAIALIVVLYIFVKK